MLNLFFPVVLGEPYQQNYPQENSLLDWADRQTERGSMAVVRWQVSSGQLDVRITSLTCGMEFDKNPPQIVSSKQRVSLQDYQEQLL